MAEAMLDTITEVVPLEIRAYDLNTRRQWRPYDRQHLTIDMITQRTQLVQLAEQTGAEQLAAGSVLIATGKHGEPPQAIATWREEWPLDIARQEQWRRAVERAFEETPLSLFVLRCASLEEDGGEPFLQMVAGEQVLQQAMEMTLGPASLILANGAGIWSYFNDANPPQELGF